MKVKALRQFFGVPSDVKIEPVLVRALYCLDKVRKVFGETCFERVG